MVYTKAEAAAAVRVAPPTTAAGKHLSRISSTGKTTETRGRTQTRDELHSTTNLFLYCVQLWYEYTSRLDRGLGDMPRPRPNRQNGCHYVRKCKDRYIIRINIQTILIFRTMWICRREVWYISYIRALSSSCTTTFVNIEQCTHRRWSTVNSKRSLQFQTAWQVNYCS